MFIHSQRKKKTAYAHKNGDKESKTRHGQLYASARS